MNATPNKRIRRSVRRTLAAAAAAVLVLAIAGTASGAGGSRSSSSPAAGLAPVLGLQSPAAIADHFIVTFGKGAKSSEINAALASVRARGGIVGHRYKAALNGFSAVLPPGAVDALRRAPGIARISADLRIRLSTSQVISKPYGPTLGNDSSWMLDRIDQRNWDAAAVQYGDGRYTYSVISPDDGGGVDAYVIDTGILPTHPDFGSRVKPGANFGGAVPLPFVGDCVGHGTHVAGILGGQRYGVAKAVNLIPVRVFGCAPTTSSSIVVAGVNWVTDDHAQKVLAAGGNPVPAVANMSLGSNTIDVDVQTAVQNSIAAGITYVAAAGNDNANACGSTPANVAAAITVGATDITDSRAGFSNYGSCLDIFAPGDTVMSDIVAPDGSASRDAKSGTSMASPAVAGCAARYLELHPLASPADVTAALLAAADHNAVTSIGAGSPNELLHCGPLHDFADDQLEPIPPNGVAVSKGYKCPGLFWATNHNSIARSNLDGTDVDENFISPATTIFGSYGAYSVTTDDTYVYWPNYTPGSLPGSIGRARLDGTDVQPNWIPGTRGGINDVAVDGSYVYWSMSAGSIGRAKKDGTAIDNNWIVTFSGHSTVLDRPSGLAITPTDIYWAKWQSPDQAIGQAGITGTPRNDTFVTNGGVPSIVRVQGSDIYWSDYRPAGSIKRMALANAGDALVKPVTKVVDNLTYPQPFAVDSTHIYYANGAWIGRANLDGTDRLDQFIPSNASGLAVGQCCVEIKLNSGVGFDGVSTTINRLATKNLNYKCRSIVAGLDGASPAGGWLTGGSTPSCTAHQDSPTGATVPSGGLVDTSTVGRHTLYLTATDRAAKTATLEVSYDVVYPWQGFFAIANEDTAHRLNLIKAGAQVKADFYLGQPNPGLNVLNLTAPNPTWTGPISCAPFSTWATTTINPAVGATLTPLTLAYNPPGTTVGRYYYGQPATGTAGQCYRFSVQTNDGTQPHTAVFRLT